MDLQHPTRNMLRSALIFTIDVLAGAISIAIVSFYIFSID
jgi:hypothetical protein